MKNLNLDCLERLARYYTIVTDLIESKSQEAFVDFEYDSRDLFAVEAQLVQTLTSPEENEKAFTLEAALTKVIDGAPSVSIKQGYDYLALLKILSFSEFQLVHIDGVPSGVLRRKDGCKVTPLNALLGVEVCPSLAKKVSCDMLMVEWSYIYALSVVISKRYTEEHLQQCPLQFLKKIEKIISQILPEIDARRFVPIKFQAMSKDGELKRWTGRGVVPTFWKEVFDTYGVECFTVGHPLYQPDIASKLQSASR